MAVETKLVPKTTAKLSEKSQAIPNKGATSREIANQNIHPSSLPPSKPVVTNTTSTCSIRKTTTSSTTTVSLQPSRPTIVPSQTIVPQGQVVPKGINNPSTKKALDYGNKRHDVFYKTKCEYA